jgi:hypothetical protein
MARLVILAALLLSALPAAAAHAQSFTVSSQMRDANFRPGINDFTREGPAVAGDSVVWWDQRDDTAVLVIASATAKPRDVLTLRSRFSRDVHVAAFGNRAIAQAGGTFYEVNVPARTVRQLDPCFGNAACAACRDRSSSTAFVYELVGTVLATGQQYPGCEEGGVHDFADGAGRRFPGPVLAAAGAYAVVFEADTMSLYNWRTGQRIRTLRSDPFLSPEERGVAVAADGTVVFADEVNHVTDNPFEASDQVRLAGGLLAHRQRIADEDFDEDWGQRSHAVFWVSRPDGSAARRVSGQRWGGSWDFDGRRLAWVTQPCFQPVIRVWDVTTGRPSRAPERCGVPRIRSGTVRLDRDQDELLFKATCPRRPARGCDGDMRAVIRLRRGGRRITDTYELPAIHMPAGTTARRWLNVADSRRLQATPGALRARFVFKSHGHRETITRDIRR